MSAKAIWVMTRSLRARWRLMPAELLPVHQAVGRISAETVAPCPPGTSVIVAGQRVPPEILESASLQSLRVVIE